MPSSHLILGRPLRVWISVSLLLLTSYMTLDKLLNFSVPLRIHKMGCVGTSLVVQRLGSLPANAGNMGLIPGLGTRISFSPIYYMTITHK